MAQITFKGQPINLYGNLPRVGEKAKKFTLIKGDLSRINLSEFKGFNLILNIFLSLDTSTCASSVRNFNKTAANLKGTKVLCISKDLPFAQSRFCTTEGIKNVIPLSDFSTGNFGKNYGLEIIDSPLAGLLSRAIIIINKEGYITYIQQVTEVSHEPDYSDVIHFLEQTN